VHADVTGPIVEVVHLVSSLNVGGQEMVILSLVSAMDRARFRSRVICLHDRGPLAPRVEAMGIPVEVIGGEGVGMIATARRLARRLRELRPDVLHTHNPSPHQVGALARRLAPVPVLIHTKHGRNVFRRPFEQWAERVAGRWSDLVVPVSRDAAEVARDDDRVPAGRIRVIHNGVTLGAAPTRPRAGATGTRAVHVARLNRIKDQGTLLAAARLVADQRPDFRLDIVGDGPLGDALRAQAAALGLTDMVTFHGMQADVQPFLAAADLFVLSSVSEGIAITLLEAMGAGLPVVATDVGGNREVVVPGVTGTLVPPRDPAAMADAIVAMLDDPAGAAALGRAGRARVEDEFNLARTVAAYESAYLELLAGKGRRAA
jgi:glycosyltransferase involved in cell wall biosynthesis